MNLRLAAATLVAALCIALPVHAQSAFDRMRATPGDAAWLGVAVPIDLGLLFIEPARPDRQAEPFALDVAARDGLDWRRPDRAARASDWLLRGFMLSFIVAPPLGNLDLERGTGNGVLVGAEALAATQLVTGTVKHLVRRERPDGEARHGHEAWASFFSGHTSVSFAGATMLTVYAHEYDWGGDTGAWAVPAVAYSLAGLTGYLRVAGRRHWLTDVLAGAVVGTGTAYLSYRLRTQW